MNQVLILGAGYAGMTAALGLAARTRGHDVHIALVNPADRFTERVRLHQTASGQQLADLQIPIMLAGTGIEFVRGAVTSIDPERRAVRVDDARTLHYDTLVFAMGAVTDTAAVPGVHDHAATLDSMGDAQRFADRLRRLERATVIVGGAGLTGIESAAEIAEQHPGLRVVLITRHEPGATMSRRAQEYLRGGLERLSVEVRRGTRITKVLPDGVELAGGEYLAADAVLWTAGVRATPLAAVAGLTVDDRGRILTDPSLRSVSHPDIYAVGDAGAVAQNYGVIHGTCGSAITSAAHTADSIARELAGKAPKPFRFAYFHQHASLGRHDAVVQFTHPDETPSRFVLTGRRAAAYKEGFSRTPWPTFRLIKKFPDLLQWPRGGRATRVG